MVVFNCEVGWGYNLIVRLRRKGNGFVVCLVVCVVDFFKKVKINWDFIFKNIYKYLNIWKNDDYF